MKAKKRDAQRSMFTSSKKTQTANIDAAAAVAAAAAAAAGVLLRASFSVTCLSFFFSLLFLSSALFNLYY